MNSRVRQTLALAALAAATLAASAGAQVQASLSGRVTDLATGQPIPLASVSIVGTSLGAQTNGLGQYTIRGVNAGRLEVRALRVGYAEKRGTLTVTSGQAATLDFSMSAVPTTLSPVVTTVTGEQRRVEVGNAIAQVDASKLKETTAITSVGDLLTSRAPGVMVVPGTQIGAGTRVRIRGTSSLSLSNNPIYIIDGTRVEGATGSSTVSVGGTLPARVNDLNPEEIETIEVVRGPSAATLYGTDAANGVIVITTKRGTAGKMQVNYSTEQGARVDKNHYPDAYRAWRSGATAALTSTPSNVVQCFLSQVTANVCKQDSITKFNLYNDPETTPNGAGYRQQHALQLSGGTEALRYFMSGQWEDESGVLVVPQFDQRYLAARGATLRAEELNPNHQRRVTTRGNFNIVATPTLDFALNTGFTSQDTRLPTSDDSGVNGVAGNTYGGPGMKYNLAANGDTLWGWRQFTPRDIYQTYTNQGITRLITSLNSNWRPAEWLSGRANIGVDYANRLDTQLCRFGSCPDLGGDTRKGFKVDNRTNFFTYATDASATATHQVKSNIASKTTAGIQFNRSSFDRNGASGTQLPPGAVAVTAGAIKSADESTSDTRTLGGFVEEGLSFNERLFLTAAIRTDKNSAFGADFKRVYYPKLSASWVVSEESFFPKYNWLNQFRLRSAYGASGVQPGTIDAVQYFSASTARLESGDAPAVVFSTLGNVNLRPERSTEMELGFDGSFFSNRLTTEVTYYNKASRDALISRILPPSLGTGANSRFENLGKVSNVGWELLVNAQMLQRSAFGWDVTLSASANKNNLDSLGGLPNIISSSTAQQREGYPLNGWWSRALTSYSDKNGDGIVMYSTDASLSEVTVTDTLVYLGNPIPRYEASLTNGFDFMKRRLHIGGMVDYKGGYKTYNNTERIRCGSRNNCAGLLDPKASLFEQARTAAQRDHPAKTVAGFIESGDFIRFRELNLTYTASEQFVNKYLHGRRLSTTVAARNLGILWSKYTGVDPEAFTSTGDAPSEFQAFGPTSYYVLRFSFGF